MLLTEVRLPNERPAAFPFTVPVIANLQSLPLDAPVTILVGENGSGKSTLLEALAYACELLTAGSYTLDRDNTLAHVRSFGDLLQLSWTRRTRRGFFFRAEDFFGYVKAQNRMKRELRRSVEALREEYRDQPELEFERVASSYTSSLAATERRYGKDLDANSHGESFLAFFRARLANGGLYLLDEPEAALSPLRQLAFLSLMKETVARGGSSLWQRTHLSSWRILTPPYSRLAAAKSPRHHLTSWSMSGSCATFLVTLSCTSGSCRNCSI